MEQRCTGIIRMWITGSEFKRLTDICNAISWINNRVLRLTNSINITTRTDRITTYRRIKDVFTVTYSNRSDRRKTSINGTDVAQTKDLRNKTGDLVSDLKILSDLRGHINPLQVHTNTFFSNSSELTVLEKDVTLLFCSRRFTGM